MRNSLVYLLDKLVIGYNHVMFNSAISKIVAQIYKDQQVVFTGESSHTKEVALRNPALPNLHYKSYVELPLPQSNLRKLLPWFQKKRRDLLFINRFYTETRTDATAVFFTCLSAVALAYAGRRFRNSKADVFFILHGEVEFMFKKELRKADKIKGLLYKMMLQNMQGNERCIVLSGIVRDRLQKEGIVAAERIVTIEHPIVDKVGSFGALNGNITIFAHIGSAMSKKRSDIFVKLADSFEEAIALGRTAFHMIGKLDPEYLHINLSNVKVVSEQNRSLSQQDYERYIHQADYAIFTFDKDNYVYRVSGALMDAILYRKPLVALKQDYIEYLFEQGGNIGFLCDTVEEMRLIIKRLIDRDPVLLTQYQEQQMHLGLLRDKFSIESVEQQLRKQIKVR